MRSRVTWSITAGSFQTGLSLNAGTGVLSGTPSVFNTQVVTIKVTDARVEVMSEGHWKRFTHTLEASEPR